MENFQMLLLYGGTLMLASMAFGGSMTVWAIAQRNGWVRTPQGLLAWFIAVISGIFVLITHVLFILYFTSAPALPIHPDPSRWVMRYLLPIGLAAAGVLLLRGGIHAFMNNPESAHNRIWCATQTAVAIMFFFAALLVGFIR